ncbi:MAG: hypothetical protein ABI597_11910, partial [Gammaproteobacteria bacterium]
MSTVLKNKIAEARRRHTSVSLVTGVGAAVLYVAVALCVGLLIDRFAELPWAARLVLAIIYAVGA